MGTPEFSAPSLHALINDDQFNILSVVTQPDKKIGRKQILTPPPVKILADQYRIPVLQPVKLSEIVSDLKSLNPDIIIVIAYAKKINLDILAIPKFGVINVHGSLLPNYRGASCIQSAILAGDNKTGVTIIKMDANIDTGPILAQAEIAIDNNDTYGTLYNKLSVLGASLLLQTLKKYLNGKISLKEQDRMNLNYSPILKKEDGIIQWSNSAEQIERFVRAMDPWPSAWTKLNGKIIKILKANSHTLEINKYEVGKLFIHESKLAVQCGKGALIIENLLIEGKKPMDAKTFILGYKDFIGSVLS